MPQAVTTMIFDVAVAPMSSVATAVSAYVPAAFTANA